MGGLYPGMTVERTVGNFTSHCMSSKVKMFLNGVLVVGGVFFFYIQCLCLERKGSETLSDQMACAFFIVVWGGNQKNLEAEAEKKQRGIL